MRNKYRNKRQIKTNRGRLADYTLLLFEETVKAIFNKAMREGLVKFNPVHSLNKLERFHAPDKHREYLTPEELTRFLAVEAECENVNDRWRADNQHHTAKDKAPCHYSAQ